jgi:hypothetical protein
MAGWMLPSIATVSDWSIGGVEDDQQSYPSVSWVGFGTVTDKFEMKITTSPNNEYFGSIIIH